MNPPKLVLSSERSKSLSDLKNFFRLSPKHKTGTPRDISSIPMSEDSSSFHRKLRSHLKKLSLQPTTIPDIRNRAISYVRHITKYRTKLYISHYPDGYYFVAEQERVREFLDHLCSTSTLIETILDAVRKMLVECQDYILLSRRRTRWTAMLLERLSSLLDHPSLSYFLSKYDEEEDEKILKVLRQAIGKEWKIVIHELELWNSKKDEGILRLMTAEYRWRNEIYINVERICKLVHRDDRPIDPIRKVSVHHVLKSLHDDRPRYKMIVVGETCLSTASLLPNACIYRLLSALHQALDTPVSDLEVERQTRLLCLWDAIDWTTLPKGGDVYDYQHHFERKLLSLEDINTISKIFSNETEFCEWKMANQHLPQICILRFLSDDAWRRCETFFESRFPEVGIEDTTRSYTLVRDEDSRCAALSFDHYNSYTIMQTYRYQAYRKQIMQGVVKIDYWYVFGTNGGKTHLQVSDVLPLDKENAGDFYRVMMGR